ncbi:hypothetical protein MNBD_BACTEROID01-2750 [hydrothermal vent metagenome]|uniref:Nudix hydrolase domain-containing protein n=1 Tax=hydrothermal vent metagenome TaxID=652676 RepID=A0A3B0U3S6_9ZZZZ
MPETHHSKVIQFCPKCGSNDFPPDSGRSFKCRNCGFHFFINSAAAVAALAFNAKGELLFTRRAITPNKGKLDLPGGFIDPGESAEEALKRELKEELGVNVVSLEYFTSAPNEYVFSGYSVFTLDMAFIVVPESLEGLVAMDDISGFEFIRPADVDFNDLPALSMQYFVKEAGRRL